MDISNFDLSKDFQGHKLRECMLDGIRHYSVIDVIRSICGAQTKYAHNIWDRLVKKSDSELFTKCAKFSFPDTGKDTPVANVEDLLEIVFLLPGNKAQKYRQVGVHALIGYLNPTPEFIERLQDRYDFEKEPLPRFLGDKDIKNKVVTKPGYETNNLYVRIALPEEYNYPVPANIETRLNNTIIKFGITCNLKDRDRSYKDNGYFLFSFSCHSTREAKAVESTIISDFETASVDRHYEYLHTDLLSKMLGVEDYDVTSYEDYLLLAEKLYVYIVKRIKTIWPDRYENHHGYCYQIMENVQKCVQSKLSFNREHSPVEIPIEERLTFPRRELTKVDAVKMGIVLDNQLEFLLTKEKEAVIKTQKQLLTSQLHVSKLQEQLKKTKTELRMMKATITKKDSSSATSSQVESFSEDGDGVDNMIEKERKVGKKDQKEDQLEGDGTEDENTSNFDVNLNGRSKGSVIGRDLFTGEDVIFPSAQRAADSCGITLRTLQRIYLNQPRQCGGKHWRSHGKPYWKPPKGFVYNPDVVINGSMKGYIKCVSKQDPSDIKFYEGIEGASQFTSLTREVISDHIGKGKPHEGMLWYDAVFTDYGNSWEYGPSEYAIATTALPDNGVNGRCKGKIIARHLQTGEEIIYGSATRAAANFAVSAHALEETYINKARQMKGYHFRKFDEKRFWNPPAYFKYDSVNMVKFESYIICIDADGNRSMYETMKSAAKHENISISSISKDIDTEMMCKGKYFKRATTEEYEVWVDL
jgi:hypothetical protein